MKTRTNNTRSSGPVRLTGSIQLLSTLFLVLLLSACQSGSREKGDRDAAFPDLVAYENDTVFTVVAQPPGFPGGNAARNMFLQEHLEYPPAALEAGVEGTVFASFVVRFDGHVTDVGIVRGVSYELDKEVLRVLGSMPVWEPGRLEDGNPVSVIFHMPVRFVADEQAVSQRIPRGREGEVLVIIGEEVFIRETGQRTWFDDLIDPDQIESLVIITDEEALEAYGYETVILITKKN